MRTPKRGISSGTAFFRGSLPPRLDNFTQLAPFPVHTLPAPPGAHWHAKIDHPQWGTATITCLRDFLPPPPVILKFDPRLTNADRAAAAAAGSWVSVELAQDNILRDRKRLLRFLHLLLGDDGLIAVDHISQKFWSVDALSEELLHDADLDIESLFATHAVHSGTNTDGIPTVDWLHTHGLAEIGAIDFDILRPARCLHENAWDVIRALAYLTLDKGPAIIGQTIHAVSPGPPIQFSDISVFNRTASRADREMRGDPNDPSHNTSRVVLCDPATRRRLFGLLPANSVPSRTLSTLDGDRVISRFPNAATFQMAERARKTFHLFREFSTEFADLGAKPLAKIGYPIDNSSDEREHMWFEVHAIGDDAIDATLINNPQNVSDMKMGDRRHHPVEFLTDWIIFTPIGSISPRNFLPVRILRTHGAEFRKQLKDAPQSLA